MTIRSIVCYSIANGGGAKGNPKPEGSTEMKFRDSKTGAMVSNAYSVIKYCGGVNCGSAIDLATLDQCMEFANDGFCDYCRITCNDGSVLKVHFSTPEQETMEPAWHEY